MREECAPPVSSEACLLGATADLGIEGEATPAEGPATPEGWLKGLSDHYLRVTFPGPPALHNRLVMVRFCSRQGEVLVGEAVGEP